MFMYYIKCITLTKGENNKSWQAVINDNFTKKK